MTSLSTVLRHATLVVAVCALAACSSKADRIAAGLSKGADYVHAYDWDKAGVEVRNVLQMDPKNARAHLISAQIAEGQRDVQRAYGNYLKATELDPALLEAKVGLARLYLLAGEVAKAQAQVDEVLKADAGQVGARTLQAAITARGGDQRAAAAQAQAIVASVRPVPSEASMLLAGLYINQGEITQAAGVIDAALAAEPDNVSLLQVAAQVAADPRATPELAKRAPEFYRRAAAKSMKSREVWDAWVAHHVRRGETDAAEAVLRDAVAAQPDDTRRTLTLVDFIAVRRGTDAAVAACRTAIEKRPKDTELRFGLVNLYRNARRDGDAQQVLKDIVELAPQAPSALAARNQLAAYRLAAGLDAEARTLVAEVLQASPRDNDALMLRGRLLLREGNARDAIVDLRAAARDQPGSAEVIGLLAQAHIAAGEPQLAREVLVDAVKFRPEDLPLRLLLVAHMADAKEYAAAQTEIDDGLRVAPDQPRLYEVKAQLLASQKDLRGAEAALVAMKDRLPQQAAGYLGLGQFYVDQRRLDAALKVYDAGIAAVPADPALDLSAIRVLAEQKKTAQIESRIEALSRQPAKQAAAQQIRAELALARKDLPAAEAAYGKLIEIAPAMPIGYQGLARVLAARQDRDGALQALQRGIDANPDSVALQAYRAEWLARAARYEEAIRAYEALLAKHPGDEEASNNLAYLLVEVKGDAASLQRALTLTGRFAESRNPSYLDSLGWVHYRLGDYAKAVPLLDRAVTLQPDSPQLASHLGMALIKSGDAKRGQEILKKVLSAKAEVNDVDEVRKLAGVL